MRIRASGFRIVLNKAGEVAGNTQACGIYDVGARSLSGIYFFIDVSANRSFKDII